MESIPYNLPPLPAVMEQIKSERCPLNVIYIRVLRGHCLTFSMGAGIYLLQIPYWVPTQFQELIFPAKTRPKIPAQMLNFRTG